MATTTTDNKEYAALQRTIVKSLESRFPIEGKHNIMEVQNVKVDNVKDPLDVEGQLKAKLLDRDWSNGVYGDVTLKNKATGKIIDKRKMKLTNIPAPTARGTYLHKGNEYNSLKQFILRPMVFVRKSEATNMPEAHINTSASGGKRIRMHLDPKTMQYKMEWGRANPHLYSVLKAQGVPDEQIKKALGKQVYDANKTASVDSDIMALYKTLTKKTAPDYATAAKYIKEFTASAKMDPKGNAISLGAPYKNMSGEALLATAGKLKKVYTGEVPEDIRDSLGFKRYVSIAKSLPALVTKDRKTVRRIQSKVDNALTVKDAMPSTPFGDTTKSWFNGGYAEMPNQYNPIDIVSSRNATTILGPGGIASEHGIPSSAKDMNSSQLGFLGPINTPESARTGITLKLADGADIDKNGDLITKMFNVKTGKLEPVTVAKAQKSIIAFPGEVKIVKGKAVFKGKDVIAQSNAKGVHKVAKSKVDYVLPAASSALSSASNLIPLLGSVQGTRAMMASRQMEQGVSLLNPEIPLLQTATHPGSTVSMEDIMGNEFAQPAPIAGKVTSIDGHTIRIKGEDGKLTKVQLYDNFPLQDKKSYLDTTKILVKPGDMVTKGQPLADTNHTKDGVLANGKNLLTGYTPYKGFNFEDGIVLSENAAKKMTSTHLHRKEIDPKDHIMDKKKFIGWYGNNLTREQQNKLDDQGVIRLGSTVEKGDVVLGAIQPEVVGPDNQEMRNIFKQVLPRNTSTTWTSDFPGKVVRVSKPINGTIKVHIRTEEPAVIGDKIVNRFANKGIITKIVPTDEMPITKDGRRLEVLLSPTVVPTRINPAQILELGLTKVAKKKGKPLKIANFDPNIKNMHEHTAKLLAENGLTSKEDVKMDPTKDKTVPIAVGDAYFIKQKHMVEDKSSARAGGPGYGYTMNRIPSGGGKRGGQTMDAYGLYALLAHGATHNIQEMQTYKSDMLDSKDNIWTRIKEGKPLPPPQVPFSFDKMTGMLKGAGIDVKKNGAKLTLQPLTDADTIALAKRTRGKEIPNPDDLIWAKNNKPKAGGLMDPAYVGHTGTEWSYFKLPTRMPNPVFQKPIASLLGIKEKELYSDKVKDATVMNGQLSLGGEAKGAAAIEEQLSKIKPAEELKKVTEELKTAKGSQKNALYRKARYLKALDIAGLSPTEAYMQKTVAVLPKTMRPITTSAKMLTMDDANELYRIVGLRSKAVASNNKTPELPSEDKILGEQELYTGLRDLAISGATIRGNRRRAGFLERIGGATTTVSGGKKQPKEGFFQSSVIGKRQDASMRSTILPNDGMGIDEVGIPAKMARVMYEPFTLRQLKQWGNTPLRAKEMINNDHPLARKALEVAIENRPVLLKRDPVLHKHGVMAFQPKLVEGKAIKIHPLVTSGYNADFDGDQMSVYLPISDKAVEEAKTMVPSKNLFDIGTGKLIGVPRQDAVVGLNHAVKIKPKAKVLNSPSFEAMDSAYRKGKIDVNTPVKIRGKVTTPGRSMVFSTLSEPMQKKLGKKVLHDPKFNMTSGDVKSLLADVSKYDVDSYGSTASKLNIMGNDVATTMGATLGLDDIKPFTKLRDNVVNNANKELDSIDKGPGNNNSKYLKKINVMAKATDQLTKDLAKASKGSDSNLWNMTDIGARGSKAQYQQMVAAPMMVEDTSGRTVDKLVGKSYVEGLPMPDYFTSLNGARRGMIGRSQMTARPGVIMKRSAQATLPIVVSDDDCGTSAGIMLPVDSREVLGRYAAAGSAVPKNTLITSRVVDSLKAKKVRRLKVRSPLKCESSVGVCKKCMGLDSSGDNYTIGTNVGVQAAQSIGNPLAQGSMDQFHKGGLAESGTGSIGVIDRVEMLLKNLKNVPDEAPLATTSGKVTAIKKNAIGGKDLYIDKTKHFIPVHSNLLVKPGDSVKKGARLGTGNINTQQLLSLTDMPTVQNYLTDELHKVVGATAPVHRKHIEVIVRGLTDTAVVDKPGDSSYFSGQTMPYTKIDSENKKLKNKIKYTNILKGLNSVPLAKSEDWLARLQHNRITDTLIEGASQGWQSNLAGNHPIPGMAYGADFGKTNG